MDRDTYWLRIGHLRLTKLPWTIELLNIAVQMIVTLKATSVDEYK